MKDGALSLTGELLAWQINLVLTRVISAATGQPDLGSSLPKDSGTPVPSKSLSFCARPPSGPLTSFLPSLRGGRSSRWDDSLMGLRGPLVLLVIWGAAGGRTCTQERELPQVPQHGPEHPAFVTRCRPRLPPYPLHFLVGMPRLTSQSEHPSHELTLFLGRGKGVFLLVPEGLQIGLAFRDSWPLPSRCNTLLFPYSRGQDKCQPELRSAPLELRACPLLRTGQASPRIESSGARVSELR